MAEGLEIEADRSALACCTRRVMTDHHRPDNAPEGVFRSTEDTFELATNAVDCRVERDSASPMPKVGIISP